MSAEKDITLDEKRVYGEKHGKTEVFVATQAGLVRVEVSGTLVGEFGLAWRGVARDVAVGGGRVAVAGDEDVLVGEGEGGGEDRDDADDGEDANVDVDDDVNADVRGGSGFTETGFGSATAVGFDGDTLVAAGEGHIARFDAAEREWETVSEVAEVRAIDGGVVAAAGGVFRLDGTHVGLDDAYDVSTVDAPLAATASGLYRLGNGWLDEHDGAFRVVTAADDGRAHAATRESLYARRSSGWEPVELPTEEPVVGVGYGEMGHGETGGEEMGHEKVTYAVTEAGTFLAGDDGEWASRSLGLADVRGLAVA